MRDVAVVGVGMHRFGELWEASLRELCRDVALKALEDAGVDRVDSVIVGSMASGLFADQEHLGALVADVSGCTPASAMRAEAACASGGMALRAAFAEVASGLSECALVVGAEKMTDVSGDEATAILATAGDQEYEAFHGVTFAGLSAMIARAYMHKHGVTSEQLAAVAVKNHKHGMLNPLAQFQMELTVPQVMASPIVADPLRLLDCAPVSDGAAAVVVCPLDMAKRLKRHPLVRIAGIGAATDRIALYRHPDLTRLPAVAAAGRAAFAMARTTPADIHVAELHDAFTIMEVLALEELGFFEAGKGAQAAASGWSAIGGRMPVNPGGGLKSRGHPVGATGVAQISELTLQLRQAAGRRQVAGARRGLAENLGGSGGTAVVTILEAV